MVHGPEDDDAVPEQTSDYLDRGWGDDPRDEQDPDDVRRFLDEVPPHHGD